MTNADVYVLLQIHLEDKSSVINDGSSYASFHREALGKAKSEVREQFEASVAELKEKHRMEMQEGKKYSTMKVHDNIRFICLCLQIVKLLSTINC
jgi:hypothetical protein